MKKQTILYFTLFYVIFFTVFPTTLLNTSMFLKSNEIVDTPKDSSESGGGYNMDASASFSWIELVGNGGILLTEITNDDDDYQKLNISELAGWTFTFYETEYDCIYISSNGWMSFPNYGDTEDWLYDIPDISKENEDCVALFCDDLSTKNPPDGSGDIYYRFFGTTPDTRYLVIEYYQVSYYGGIYLGTFEVIFYKSGDIKFQYLYLQDIFGGYLIGLDHGDLTNYNTFDDWLSGQDVNAKAILFTYSGMDQIQYNLGVSVNDQITWIVIKVNNIKMELLYGPNWEEKFGLLPNPTRGFKTKINITSIEQNSTHWDINYTLWDWTYRFDDFSSLFSHKDSLLYRKEPLDYTEKHNLTNIFPLFVPKHPYLYLKNANLSDYHTYDYIYYSSYSGITYLQFEDDQFINGDFISIYSAGGYNNDGILEELYIDCYNQSSSEQETILEMQLATPNFLSNFQLGFNIGAKYDWKILTVNDSYMDLYFGTDWEQKFSLFPSMATGEKTMICISSISENSTHWEIKYDMWDWIPASAAFNNVPDMDPIVIYRKEPFNYTQVHNLTYIAPFLLPKPTYEYLSSAYLDEGFYYYIDYFVFEDIHYLEFGIDFPGGEVWGYASYDSNGILISLTIVYEDEINDDFFTIFKMKIISPEPTRGNGDDDDDDDKKDEAIPGYNIFILIGIVALISIALIKKRKKLNQ